VLGDLTVASGFNAFPGLGGSNTLNFTGNGVLVIMDDALERGLRPRNLIWGEHRGGRRGPPRAQYVQDSRTVKTFLV
jgi:hypothetical protein